MTVMRCLPSCDTTAGTRLPKRIVNSAGAINEPSSNLSVSHCKEARGTGNGDARAKKIDGRIATHKAAEDEREDTRPIAFLSKITSPIATAENCGNSVQRDMLKPLSRTYTNLLIAD